MMMIRQRPTRSVRRRRADDARRRRRDVLALGARELAREEEEEDDDASIDDFRETVNLARRRAVAPRPRPTRLARQGRHRSRQTTVPHATRFQRKKVKNYHDSCINGI